eukprot:COSAG01_NODE_6459_length_3657_cov_2.202923_3_plen_31_part_00
MRAARRTSPVSFTLLRMRGLGVVVWAIICE